MGRGFFSEGVVTEFTYDDRWRIVNTFRVSSGTIDTYAKERFVHHAAGPLVGVDGRRGSSYIDSMILADRNLIESETKGAQR